MKKNDLEDVLLKFSFKEDDCREAEAAFTIFYREYAKYLYKVVIEAGKKYPFFYSEFLDDVVTNTFLKIYENPLSFKINDEDSDSAVNNKLKAYLAQTAKNNLYDLINSSKKDNHLNIIDDDENTFDPPQVDINDDIPLSEIRKILDEVLLSFSERDRLILLTIYEYHEEGKKTPTPVLDWLTYVHGTSRDNIKAIKSRCNKKIIERFKAYTFKDIK